MRDHPTDPPENDPPDSRADPPDTIPELAVELVRIRGQPVECTIYVPTEDGEPITAWITARDGSFVELTERY